MKSTFKVLQKKVLALWHQIRIGNWSTLEVMFANIKRLMIEGRDAAIQGCPRSWVENLKDPNLYLPYPQSKPPVLH